MGTAAGLAVRGSREKRTEEEVRTHPGIARGGWPLRAWAGLQLSTNPNPNPNPNPKPTVTPALTPAPHLPAAARANTLYVRPGPERPTPFYGRGDRGRQVTKMASGKAEL